MRQRTFVRVFHAFKVDTARSPTPRTWAWARLTSFLCLSHARAVPVPFERGADRAARALISLVGEDYDVRRRECVDQADRAGGGQVVGAAR
jgi:hypothetical protein